MRENLVSICTFNLHGKEENNETRIYRIAEELSELKPDLCALQEVVVDGGKSTAEKLARTLEGLTGETYRVHFVETHMFYEKYPEGVAVLSRHPFELTGSIDLSDLGNLSPLLPRRAALSTVRSYGKEILFISVHLDHHPNPAVREAQVKKLLGEIRSLQGDCHAVILAGDFNDTEASPALAFLRNRGFNDAYRILNDDPGYTFPATNPKARIDYILTKGANVVSSRVIMKSGLSDHFGVWAGLEIRE